MSTGRVATAAALVLAAAAPSGAHGRQADVQPPQDWGVGVLYFSHPAVLDESLAWADTVFAHEAPASESPVVARFIYEWIPPSPVYPSVSIRLESAMPGVVDNHVLFDYDNVGVPLDASPGDADWVRLVFGRDEANRYHHGWARLDGLHTEYVLWRDWLDGQMLYFMGPIEEAVLLDRPGGAPVHIDISALVPGDPERETYDLETLEVDGRWMRVRVVVPGLTCWPPREARATEGWVEFLDGRGRPLIWHHIKGC